MYIYVYSFSLFIDYKCCTVFWNPRTKTISMEKKNTSQYTPVPKTWIFSIFDIFIPVFMYQLKKAIWTVPVSHVCLFRFAVSWKHNVSNSTKSLVIDNQWWGSRRWNLNYSSSKGDHMRLWFMLAMGQSYVLMKGESYALMTNLITLIWSLSVTETETREEDNQKLTDISIEEGGNAARGSTYGRAEKCNIRWPLPFWWHTSSPQCTRVHLVMCYTLSTRPMETWKAHCLIC